MAKVHSTIAMTLYLFVKLLLFSSLLLTSVSALL